LNYIRRRRCCKVHRQKENHKTGAEPNVIRRHSTNPPSNSLRISPYLPFSSRLIAQRGRTRLSLGELPRNFSSLLYTPEEIETPNVHSPFSMLLIVGLSGLTKIALSYLYCHPSL